LIPSSSSCLPYTTLFRSLPGLEEAFRSVYPKADVQRCVVHKVRNTLHRVRKKDQFEVAEDLKLIYRAPNKEIALQMFQQFESKWSSKYPREVQSWANELSWMSSLHLWIIQAVFEV